MITVTMPKKVLDCRALTRTISFTSMHRIDHLKMRHRELVSVSTKIILIFFKNCLNALVLVFFYTYQFLILKHILVTMCS